MPTKISGRQNEVGEQYSLSLGLIYVFNLIVGTGALTMPNAIAETGWLIGVIMIVFIAFMSFVTATFTIEAMACANAFTKWSTRQRQSKKMDKEVADSDERDITPQRVPSGAAVPGSDMNVNSDEADERSSLIDKPFDRESVSDEPDYYDISLRIEFGEMAAMFLNRCGMVTFYLIIIIYLFGDLAIYAAAVPKSLRDVICNYHHNVTPGIASNVTQNNTLKENEPCFGDKLDGLTRFEMYQIMLTVFFVCQLPFVFFNVQKTKWLQIITSSLRWISFIMMISISIWRIAVGQGAQPSVANITGIPTLFGSAIYSFMCHHSLPSLISPIKDKTKTNKLFVIDYTIIMFFYVFLCMTAIFAFDPLQDIYTLNFAPNAPDSVDLPGAWIWVKYFVALFPVFTISASFPIIAITLRNNLKALFQPKSRPYHKCVDRVLFPFVTIVPPIVIVYFTNDVSLLVGITGAYAGAGIQYLIPAFVVWEARKQLNPIFGPNFQNKHKSPFSHCAWVWLVVGWCCIALIFVTWDLIAKRIGKG